MSSVSLRSALSSLHNERMSLIDMRPSMDSREPIERRSVAQPCGMSYFKKCDSTIVGVYRKVNLRFDLSKDLGTSPDDGEHSLPVFSVCHTCRQHVLNTNEDIWKGSLTLRSMWNRVFSKFGRGPEGYIKGLVLRSAVLSALETKEDTEDYLHDKSMREVVSLSRLPLPERFVLYVPERNAVEEADFRYHGEMET